MRIENIVRGRKLTQTDQAIVAFIAQNTERVLQMSVRDLAEASFSSVAETALVLDVLYVQLFSRHYLENVRPLTDILVG